MVGRPFTRVLEWSLVPKGKIKREEGRKVGRKERERRRRKLRSNKSYWRNK